MRLVRIPLFVLTAVAWGLVSSPSYGQTTDNTKVNDTKSQEKETGKEKKAEPKHKLKGAFKGQSIDSPQGQALSDVVTAAQTAREQKEKDRADKTKAKPVVINNEGIKASRQGAPKEASAPPEAGAGSAAAAPAVVAPFRPTDLEGHDETYWREKARSARERAERAREAVKAADEEARKQENDFYAWDDGQYRDNVIKPAWDRAKENLAAAQKEAAEAEEGLKNLEDDARKAGAQPGWIR